MSLEVLFPTWASRIGEGPEEERYWGDAVAIRPVALPHCQWCSQEQSKQTRGLFGVNKYQGCNKEQQWSLVLTTHQGRLRFLFF